MLATPMQPVYITGHSRPVRKVMHNHDGDLLFSCSDDGTVCMFSTLQCERIGVFEIKQACRSIDVSKDSKLLIACATTIGFHVFNIENGQMMKTVAVPGLQAKHVSLSYSDKEILVLYDESKRSYIRIYSMKDVMAEKSDKDVKPSQEIACSTDY